MHATIELTHMSRIVAGVLILSLVTIEYGGWFLMRVVQGRAPATEFQRSFFRAGHAHAGVLVILALIFLFLADSLNTGVVLDYVLRLSVPLAAILLPLGFFTAASHAEATEPNRMIAFVWAGMILLGIGALCLGIALLTG